jgi:hypothetical protein
VRIPQDDDRRAADDLPVAIAQEAQVIDLVRTPPALPGKITDFFHRVADSTRTPRDNVLRAPDDPARTATRQGVSVINLASPSSSNEELSLPDLDSPAEDDPDVHGDHPT